MGMNRKKMYIWTKGIIIQYHPASRLTLITR